MKRNIPLLAILLGCSLPLLGVAHAKEKVSSSSSYPAATADEGRLISVTAQDAAWLAKAKSEYPITTCVVSGEGLSIHPDEAFDFIYRKPGQADRLVSFCCEGCSKDFTHDALRFIALLDKAAAAKK